MKKRKILLLAATFAAFNMSTLSFAMEVTQEKVTPKEEKVEIQTKEGETPKVSELGASQTTKIVCEDQKKEKEEKLTIKSRLMQKVMQILGNPIARELIYIGLAATGAYCIFKLRSNRDNHENEELREEITNRERYMEQKLREIEQKEQRAKRVSEMDHQFRIREREETEKLKSKLAKTGSGLDFVTGLVIGNLTSNLFK